MSTTHTTEVATAINERRLWQRHMTMAQIDATPRGGVNRQAFSREDGRARQLLVAWARELGCTVSMDTIGNLYVRREGTEPSAAPVLTGSHLALVEMSRRRAP